MRAAGITALGEPVEILEVDEPASPAAGEVLIDVAAAGVANWDELVRIGSGGRLATITGDPPPEERGVAVTDVYVRPDGRQLSDLAELLARGTLSVPIASVRPLEQAAQALREAVAGADGAVVLSVRT